MSKKSKLKKKLNIQTVGDIKYAKSVSRFSKVRDNKKFISFDKYFFPLILSFMAILGLFASFMLFGEEIKLLKDANYIPPCSVNSVINCLPTMKSWQSEIFGFNNTVLGFIYYTGIFVFGFIQFFNRELSKKLWNLALLPVTLALMFSLWLLYNSIFVIGSVCPYCLSSCFASTTIFFTIVGKNITSKGWLRWRTWMLVLTMLISTIIGILIYKF
ncbi:hypothetical protein IPJ91_01885 [bacterium]|nr:MAG: hypothetical protein IPJ91_01885 [bacterium]